MNLQIGETCGFAVVDSVGRQVGRVECPMYGTHPDRPDALSVRSGRLLRHHFLIHAEEIDAIDGRHEVVGLRVQRGRLQRFL